MYVVRVLHPPSAVTHTHRITSRRSNDKQHLYCWFSVFEYEKSCHFCFNRKMTMMKSFNFFFLFLKCATKDRDPLNMLCQIHSILINYDVGGVMFIYTQCIKPSFHIACMHILKGREHCQNENEFERNEMNEKSLVIYDVIRRLEECLYGQYFPVICDIIWLLVHTRQHDKFMNKQTTSIINSLTLSFVWSATSNGHFKRINTKCL